MRKLITLLFFVSVFINAQAQWGQINSITWIPVSPTTVDTVKIIANSTVGYSPCFLANSSVTNLSPGNYMVDAYYCMGMLAALCGATDTFALGVLPAGTQNIYMTLYSDQSSPDPCGNYSPLDTDAVQIFVSSPTGIPGDKISRLQIISMGGNVFIIEGAERISGNKDFTLYTTDGRIAYRKTFYPGENKINLVLSQGIYFYTLMAGKEFYYGKVFSD